MVGPFIFMDHMGPAEFPAGRGINVRPHPHIGLATLTYLFDGSILHRDNLGHTQEIFPGDVNWMTAGMGIVHSERETLEVRAREHTLEGVQCWVALPEDREYVEPGFAHVEKCDLPHIMREGMMMRLIAGEAYHRASPIKTYSPLFFVDVLAQQGARIALPESGFEVAVFVVSGGLEVEDQPFQEGAFLVLEEGDESLVMAYNGRLLMFGGKPFDRVPHVKWNFVSFDRSRIRRSKELWQAGGFPLIPGDSEERIPLPR